jgi:hypothetical protein
MPSDTYLVERQWSFDLATGVQPVTRLHKCTPKGVDGDSPIQDDPPLARCSISLHSSHGRLGKNVRNIVSFFFFFICSAIVST